MERSGICVSAEKNGGGIGAQEMSSGLADDVLSWTRGYDDDDDDDDWKHGKTRIGRMRR